ncbi:peptidase inhibitor family I36 protein [Nonomuraea sp. NPDC050310]|uniref:peptidase inhibitor family I36 protein n=1 Tax=Nonomuraea sp. NPDC050310 TaxID=3154935 RepID=UPI0033C3D410
MRADPTKVGTQPEFAAALKTLVAMAVRENRITNATHLARELGLSRSAVSKWMTSVPGRPGTGLPSPAYLARLLTLLEAADRQEWLDARDRAERAYAGNGSAPDVPPETTAAPPQQGSPRRFRKPAWIAAGLACVLAGAAAFFLLRPTGYAACAEGHACLFGQRDGGGQMADLGEVRAGQRFELGAIPLSEPSTDHWHDAVDSVYNRSAHSVCLYDRVPDGHVLLGSAWSAGERANFKPANADRADTALIIAGGFCPPKP